MRYPENGWYEENDYIAFASASFRKKKTQKAFRGLPRLQSGTIFQVLWHNPAYHYVENKWRCSFTRPKFLWYRISVYPSRHQGYPGFSVVSVRVSRTHGSNLANLAPASGCSSSTLRHWMARTASTRRGYGDPEMVWGSTGGEQYFLKKLRVRVASSKKKKR